MREFNTTGLCVPRKHYMVDISGRVAQMRAMVEHGDYFCVNRGRQYGKTTTLAALRRELAVDFAVTSLDFQRLSGASFESEGAFVRGFCRMLLRLRGASPLPSQTRSSLQALAGRDGREPALDELFFVIEDWIAESDLPVVLIIDEVDSATNNQVFLDFLAQLRDQYLNREEDVTYPAFRSVILAGVTGVKHLKAKIRPEEEHKTNSPWNIAADFRVDMSFSETDVAGMLAEYEADHTTGMDATSVAREIVEWTGGYPFLVSRVCQLVDEGGLDWDDTGVSEAIKALLSESNTLFDSLSGKLVNYPELKEELRGLMMSGERIPYNPMRDDVAQLNMFSFVRRDDRNSVQVANRVFETLLYDLFIGEEKTRGSRIYAEGDLGRSLYVRGGRLDMPAVLEGFRRAYVEVFGPPEDGERFCEDEGRKQFLLFLKPIINGTGNYYVEAQTRDRTRTDVVVDYAGERFVVELKLWRGPAYNEAGEAQLAGYLESLGLDVGYLLTFSFRKTGKEPGKEPGLHRVETCGKLLWEEVV